MLKTSEVSPNLAKLSMSEMEKVTAARAAARERFKHFRDDAGEPSGVVDAGSPVMTAEQLAALRPAAEVVPGLVAASLKRKAGRPKVAAPKVAVSLRLDPEVLEKLRAEGRGWQSRVNKELRKALGFAT